MKITRALMLVLALGLASSQAHALVDVSAFGGYAMVAMGDVNKAIDSYGAGGPTHHADSGFYVGADAGITLMPFLKVGPRLKYIQANQGTVGSPVAGTIDSNLMMYEVGVSADTSLPLTGLSVLGGVWGGYGMANAKAAGGGNSTTGTGGAFVGEVGAQLRYKLFMGLSLGVDLAYTLANIQSVKDSNGNSVITTDGSPSGPAGGFDFSGLNAGGALSWDF